jgi:hypothetical protein
MGLDPGKSKYGSTMRVVGSVTAIDKYFEADYFDVVFLCGVVGWGLNKTEDVKQALMGI